MVYECSEGGVGRRRRWSEAEKRRIVLEIGEGDTSLAKVGRRYGIHASVIGRWRRRFGTEDCRPGLPAATFVPVTVAPFDAAPTVSPPSGPERRAFVEVFLSNGRRLVVAEDIAASRLRRLVAAVEG
ncbi:IS66-like element accessory protein TnpA [Oleispirillum naphthae]|uniref:IS66-like element accessory protein TnpA n=1 Tax=Oleispirillum naphthae TaxID=2838853 RepID=UPI0030825AB4